MYHFLILRQREIVAQWAEILNEHSREMALDPRFFRRIGRGSQTSGSSSASSGMTSMTTPTAPSNASDSPMKSSASSPSLRAKQPVPVTRQDAIASPAPGGNVRVVVRVRNFLKRGMLVDRGRVGV